MTTTRACSAQTLSDGKCLQNSGIDKAHISGEVCLAFRTMPNAQLAPPLINTVEAAARLRVSTRTIREWAHSGKLPAIWLSTRSLRFEAHEIQALIDEHSKVASNPQ